MPIKNGEEPWNQFTVGYKGAQDSPVDETWKSFINNHKAHSRVCHIPEHHIFDSVCHFSFVLRQNTTLDAKKIFGKLYLATGKS